MSSKKYSSSKLRDYDILGIIGTGTFGTCYKVKKKSDGHLYVWKAVNYGALGQDKKKLLVSEVNLLSQLSHPNIVRYHERIIHKPTTILYIVMEWCEGGDLASLIASCKRNGSTLKESFIWQVLYQTGRALQACHCHPTATILHRDIKPANVFLDSQSNVKLGDFGLARMLSGDDIYAQTRVGTPYYMSPEVIKGGRYTKSSDIWSLGCLIFEMCALVPPFQGPNIRVLANNILDGRFSRIPEHYSDNLQTFISLLLRMNASDRPLAENILQHPFVLTQMANESLVSVVAKKKAPHNGIVEKPSAETVASSLFDGLINSPEMIGQGEQISVGDDYIKVWLSRLEGLKRKEMFLRAKELSLFEREKILAEREKTAVMLSKMAEDKLSRVSSYLEECRNMQPVTSNIRHCMPHNTDVPSDPDTSFSADPGDTSILPTSTKVDPKDIPKPFLLSSKAAKKHVHFGTLPTIKQKRGFGNWEERWVDDFSTQNKVLSTLDVNSLDPARRVPKYISGNMLFQNKPDFLLSSNKNDIRPHSSEHENKENHFYHVPKLMAKMSLRHGAYPQMSNENKRPSSALLL